MHPCPHFNRLNRKIELIRCLPYDGWRTIVMAQCWRQQVLLYPVVPCTLECDANILLATGPCGGSDSMDVWQKRLLMCKPRHPTKAVGPRVAAFQWNCCKHQPPSNRQRNSLCWCWSGLYVLRLNGNNNIIIVIINQSINVSVVIIILVGKRRMEGSSFFVTEQRIKAIPNYTAAHASGATDQKCFNPPVKDPVFDSCCRFEYEYEE